MVGAMSERKYPCPTCGLPSDFIKTLATQITDTEQSQVMPGVLVNCPVHGEMAIAVTRPIE
jgi:hypothetical protein